MPGICCPSAAIQISAADISLVDLRGLESLTSASKSRPVVYGPVYGLALRRVAVRQAAAPPGSLVSEMGVSLGCLCARDCS